MLIEFTFVETGKVYLFSLSCYDDQKHRARHGNGKQRAEYVKDDIQRTVHFRRALVDRYVGKIGKQQHAHHDQSDSRSNPAFHPIVKIAV